MLALFHIDYLASFVHLQNCITCEHPFVEVTNACKFTKQGSVSRPHLLRMAFVGALPRPREGRMLGVPGEAFRGCVESGLITRTPKVCKIMAFRAIFRGLGLLFYILLEFR